ncbi:MAG: TetR/AcrR family transcriptional regulator [Dehalogenimonas sp.]|uniref:TetR/AcrR family transcriptional regulator n=1 Tax=Candidatus Dehalogenimonas loeffleri TaxID=3127115 RepID=A0ABZ2J5E8_9CHLR|nr:TetR/AcrR family transcriptional regulator [Dehalogenimonas sp.]
MTEHSINPSAPKRATQRDEKAVERRTQLIDTALEVFAKKGFDKTSVRELAAAAGVAQGLMYHYFKSKDQLLEAVVERHSFLPQLKAMLTTMHNEPAAKVLKITGNQFFALLGQKESLMNIFFHETQSHPIVPRIWRNILNQGIGLFQTYLDERVAAGELKPHTTDVTARTLAYTIVLLRATSVAFHHRTRPEAFINEMVDNLLSGVAAPAA